MARTIEEEIIHILTNRVTLNVVNDEVYTGGMSGDSATCMKTVRPYNYYLMERS